MLIIDWMTSKVVSIPPTASLLRCRELFKEHRIGRLPVVDKNNVVLGLITEAAIKAFSPQHGTGLEILELLDILAETKAQEIMTTPAVTINHKGTIGHAAQVMVEKATPCLPVVDDNGRLVGILSEWDVFKALVSISGADMPSGVEMAFNLENKQGTLRDILDLLKECGVRLSTVLSSIAPDGRRQVKVGFWSDNAAAENQALERLKGHADLRFWARGGEVFLSDIKK